MTDSLGIARLAAVQRHMDAENALDFDTAIDTFAHPRYEIIGLDRVYDGEASVREYFWSSRTTFPDQHNEVISLRAAGDAVITEFWLMGTHLGPLEGLAPTGKSFRVRMCAVFEFDDADGIVCERIYFNPMAILSQLTAE